MPAPQSSPKSPPLFTPFGLVLLLAFLLALAAAGLSTRRFIKNRDLPPAGTYLVLAGHENPLFVKLAQKSIKGLHRTVGLRGQLEVPGDPAPRPLLVSSRNSSEWERKIKIPQLTPGAKPTDIESHIAILLAASIPDDPALYGRTIPASFDLDMVVPRLDPQNPRIGQAVPDRVTWTMQLQIQPPDFVRLYQRVNRIALMAAGTVIVLALVRQLVRHLRAKRSQS